MVELTAVCTNCVAVIFMYWSINVDARLVPRNNVAAESVRHIIDATRTILKLNVYQWVILTNACIYWIHLWSMSENATFNILLAVEQLNEVLWNTYMQEQIPWYKIMAKMPIMHIKRHHNSNDAFSRRVIFLVRSETLYHQKKSWL